MLTASARRALPQCLPRYVRPHSTGAASEKNEALNALGIVSEEAAQINATQPIKTPVDLDNMHHHIPPASSPLLQFITTMLMRHGEYAKAAKVVSQTLLHIYALTRSPPMPIVEKAVAIASPAVRNRKMRQGGGKTGYVPQALNERQRTRLGILWMVREVEKKGRPGKTLAERLARQIIATVNGHDTILKAKDDIHRLAMVNRFVILILG